MNYARVVVAVLNSDVGAASGDDPKDCPTFSATLKIFDKFEGSSQSNASLRPITGEIIRGFNTNQRSYEEDEEVIVAQLIDETWIILSAGGGCELMLFTINEVYGTETAASDHCDDQLNDAADKYKVTCSKSCCGKTPSGAEADGSYIVHDLFSMFQGGIGGAREESDLVGKEGLAIRMSDCEGYDPCKWYVIFINWFRTIQVITNVRITDDNLIFERENVEVWDNCELDPITIPLTDCEEY